MNTEKSIRLRRDCTVIMIPSGEKVTLKMGTTIWLTQSLGGSYTIMTDRGYMARVDGYDGDALGLAQPVEAAPEITAGATSAENLEKA